MRAVPLSNDQLRQQMALGKVFAGFTEGAIRFRPTYKFDSKNKVRRGATAMMVVSHHNGNVSRS